MWLWNRLPWPSARRFAVASMSGLRKPAAFSGWQWSVCRPMRMSYRSASRWAASASTMQPSTASFWLRPEANCPPPVDIWMMPSDFESANALSAALIVVMEVMLTAG